MTLKLATFGDYDISGVPSAMGAIVCSSHPLSTDFRSREQMNVSPGQKGAVSLRAAPYFIML